MTTPDELRTAIAEGRAAFRAALEAATVRWEVAPATGEGEGAWTPRQVAEHAIPYEQWYASEVCAACGYPGIDVDRPPMPTASEALAAFDAAAAKADGRLQYVTEKDLAIPHERMGSVAGIMERNARHLREHAAQMLAG